MCHVLFCALIAAGLPVGETVYMGFYSNETEWEKKQLKVQLFVFICVIMLSQFTVCYSSCLDLMYKTGDVDPQAFHSVHYQNGTKCEVNKTPRKTVVKVFPLQNIFVMFGFLFDRNFPMYPKNCKVDQECTE